MATAELGGGPGGRGDGVAGRQQLQDQQQWEVVAAKCRDTEHSTEISQPHNPGCYMTHHTTLLSHSSATQKYCNTIILMLIIHTLKNK